MKKNFIIILFVCALYSCSTNIVMAAPPIRINGAGVYGQMQIEQLQQQNIEKNFISPVEKIKPSKEEEKFEVDVQKDLEKDGVIYNPKFQVSKINFVGNTKIKTKVLQSMATDIVGNDIYFEDLLTFALRISRYYQSRGYLTSYAYIPPQQIKNGVVTISIVESSIENFDINGNKWARTWYLKNVASGS